MKKIGALEIFLIEFVLFMAIWLFDAYLGSLMTSILAPISLVLLLIALVAEYLEPSKIPKWYFILMTLSFLTPLLVAAVYWMIFGKLEW